MTVILVSKLLPEQVRSPGALTLIIYSDLTWIKKLLKFRLSYLRSVWSFSLYDFCCVELFLTWLHLILMLRSRVPEVLDGIHWKCNLFWEIHLHFGKIIHLYPNNWILETNFHFNELLEHLPFGNTCQVTFGDYKKWLNLARKLL